MKQISLIFLLCYYVLGTILLPHADFSLLSELHKHYKTCQSTEDQDMNALDFITDHLMNIDGIFDKHTNDDDQKPHKPFQHKTNSSLAIPLADFINLKIAPSCIHKTHTVQSENLYSFNFSATVFRPPILSTELS